jgi:aryl-alcohol dehydrogenase-like predicted oxidoreductase
MRKIRISGREVAVDGVAMGCEPLGGTDWGAYDPAQAEAAVCRALDLGVTVFDTADVYGLGLSEEVLSRALGPRRHDVVIVTKFGVAWEEGGRRARTWRDASPARVRAALLASLRRLRLDRIPLYLVHWPDPATPVEATMEALARCRDEGLVEAVGVSNFTPELVRRAHAVLPLAALELQYSLLDRGAEAGLLPLARELGVTVLAYGPLAQGLLTGKYGAGARFGANDRRHRLGHFRGRGLERALEVVGRVCAAAERLGRTPAQVALRWVLDHPAVSCAIAGAKSPAQVEANAGVAGWRLPPEMREALAGFEPVDAGALPSFDPRSFPTGRRHTPEKRRPLLPVVEAAAAGRLAERSPAR